MSQPLDKLSPREREVLEVVAKGLPNKVIARQLDPPCAEETVREHLKRIFSKLDIHNRVEAVAIWLSKDGS
jgi:two-component system nitrate/nitrite response regulator NarL